MPKLQENRGPALSVSRPAARVLRAPHLVYANVDFKASNPSGEFRGLIAWLRELGLGPNWKEDVIVHYLSAKQPEFRASMKWLIKCAEDGFRLSKNSADLKASIESKPWETSNRAELEFLQAHGLRHSVISLKPVPLRKANSIMCGVDLFQGAPRDPVDPIAWHVILLMQKGLLRIRMCKFAKCGLFFEPKTPRKFYCSDLCRSKDHMKTREEMRVYMRRYRKLLRDGVVRKRRNR
jgi:hypothetical protein